MGPVRFAVIGGSGLYQLPGLQDQQVIQTSTPFGRPSDDIRVGALSGIRIAFLARHGQGHRLTPTEVPYQANIYALKQLGVEELVSVSACGSLREHLHPGDIVIPDQLFDQTRRRANTFFGEGLVAHIGVADPFCSRLAAMLAEAVAAAGATTVHRGGRSITIEGPRFSTRAESHTFRQWGMDVINMTACPEAFLAREAEICCAILNHVTDYDVWHATEEAVSVEMVIRILQQNAALAGRAIALLVGRLAASERTCGCADALGPALITQRDCIPPATIERLGPLVSKYL